MVSSEGKLEYIKECVRIQDPGNKDQVLLAISSLRDLVVVNIAGAAEMEPVLFSEENLHAILAAAPEQLFVEGLPPGKYKTARQGKNRPGGAVGACAAGRIAHRICCRPGGHSPRFSVSTGSGPPAAEMLCTAKRPVRTCPGWTGSCRI